MKISVITPFYNGSKFIKKCIQGVQSQSVTDFEYIIIDDGSEDEELLMLKGASKEFSNVTIFSTKNEKQAAAVNFGIKQAGGEYIAFCDQDDWWLPEKLEKQAKFLDEHQDIDLVYSDAFLGDEAGTLRHETWMQSRKVFVCTGGYTECAKKLFERNFICAPLVVMVRSNALLAIGGINEQYTSAYDYDLWFRLLEWGSKFAYLDEPLAVWRSHSQNESGDVRRAKKIQTKILLNFLIRNKKFVFKHPILVVIKFFRILLGFLVNYNPY
ncbi:MAG: glycosyl transferase family protein [Parcubacteria group bacterium LiPW_41]|nr:MAG: glycosyl transferase family protein [Parcubacteria group bacterium LiPW_41]